MARAAKRVKPRFWLILMAIMLVGFFYLYSTQEAVLRQQAEAITQLRETASQMEVEIAASTRKLEFSKSDDYVERIARSSLGMVMPEEVLYVSSGSN